MDRFKKIGVPSDILALIAKPPLLPGESKDQYFDLLAGVIQDFLVRDRPGYLLATQYVACHWGIIRKTRMQALVTAHWAERGREALVTDRDPGAFTKMDDRLAELYPGGVDTELVTARGMILADANKQLAYLDKSIERLQSRADNILQLLEMRRDMLAYRERERLLASGEQLRIADQSDASSLEETDARPAARVIQ